MKLQTVAWKSGSVVLIDQTQLPQQCVYIRCRTVRQVWESIRQLKVRGAPAIGAAAGLGLVLGVAQRKVTSRQALHKRITEVFDYLAGSRPTAVNLIWALRRVRQAAESCGDASPQAVVRRMLQEAQAIITEDKQICRCMAAAAQPLIKPQARILTVCNTGILATVDYGTALGVVYRAHELKKKISVYACETRPLLQGARLTCWELQQANIPATLICDNMAGYIMQQGLVDSVFIGADRIARNGDTANKIGSYMLAVLARYHRIPFYVVAPQSTFDARLTSGRSIPIEQRDPAEIREKFFRRPIAPQRFKVYNPAFDVVPQRLISAIVCEHGILKPPFTAKIRRICMS